MATITPTIVAPTAHGDTVHTVTWALMTKTTDDVGTAIQMAGSNDRSIQVTGTFGAGGNLKIEGSNDGTNYYTLNDPSSTALDFTSAKIEQVLELTKYIRPRVTAGDVTTSLTVTMCLRRPFK